jgi:tRNA A-37 threonylcarbamoyl transferase component Bud32
MQHALQIRSAEQMESAERTALSPACRRAAGCDYTALAIGEFKDDELARLVTSPERALSDPTATVVKQGRSALVVRVDLPIGGAGTRTAYKRSGSRSWLRRIARGMRPSAAVRNFRLGHRLLELGIETPRPLIAVSPRWHNLLRPSYLATEWIDGAVPLDAFAKSESALSPARRRMALRETARQLGRLIGTLHNRGYAHRDLKSANLLVREREGRVEVFLIDLDGASRAHLRLKTTRLKNLARLQQATARMACVTQTLRRRFLHSYLATLSGAQDWKTVWRQVGRISRIPPPPMLSHERGDV